jgi:sugar phosphate isomerase/epimerase
VELACSTLSFRADLAGALREVAVLGFPKADLVAIPFYRQILPADLARDPREQASRISSAMAAAGVGAATMNAAVGDLHDRSAESIGRRAAEWRGIAAVMRELRIGLASFYPGYLPQGKAWHAALDGVAASVTEMREIAAAQGVEFLLEAHYDTPVSTPEQIRTLMEAVPGLRFVYDPSHFAMQGLEPAATDFLLDRSAHVHLRDAAPGRMNVAGGRGTVDFDRLIRALAERGYAGYLAIECLPPEEGPPNADIRAVRRLVEAAVERAGR